DDTAKQCCIQLAPLKISKASKQRTIEPGAKDAIVRLPERVGNRIPTGPETAPADSRHVRDTFRATGRNTCRGVA
ncbi:hypothetical protein GWI33_003133, partial [Rhynchophorus ferrugineus]